MKRAIGFIHRVVYATLFAATAWYACTTPFTSGKEKRVLTWLCYTFNYPTALIGRLTSPIRGMDVFNSAGSTWCDACTRGEALWYHIRFAVPVYVILFYIPTILKWIVKKWRSRPPNEPSSEVESPNHA